jgi:hypothetical protein
MKTYAEFVAKYGKRPADIVFNVSRQDAIEDTLQKLKELGFGKMVGCVGCDAGYHDGDCPEDTNLKCLFFVPLDIEATLKELEK